MNSSSTKQALSWLAAFGGAGLIVAAVKGFGPVAGATAALQGTTAPRTKINLASIIPGFDLAGVAAGTSTDSVAGGTLANEPGPPGATVADSVGGPISLAATTSVATGNGKSIRLAPSAAAPFTRWVASFGQPIPCTQGWRSVAEADAGHAADPARFASGATSWHCKGLAVDVDLTGMAAATLSRLRVAAKANGWLQARWGGEATCGSNTSNDNEPWHFSYGGCG